MANILDFLRLDIGSESKIYLPKTVAKAVYTTDDTSISGITLDQFINRHQHNMADIRDLNIGDDGGLILKPLTILFNGAKLLDYDGMAPQTMDFSLNSLGAASAGHNHDATYSKLSHAHSSYAPLVHTHAASDIVDLGDIGGGGDIQPLRIQFDGFDKMTFDGKTTKTLNITATDIGAAATFHTHPFNSITDVVLPVFRFVLYGRDPDKPEELITTIEYDGSKEVIETITPNMINAAPRSHYHDGEYPQLIHTHLLKDITDRPVGLDSGYVRTGLADGKVAGSMSTAEGRSTQAEGTYSHAEGAHCKAIGSSSHAEGFSCIARGDYSHAEGFYSAAMGEHSHASGYRTLAYGNQMAVGYLNAASTGIEPGDGPRSVFVVGGGVETYESGVDSIRKNLFRVSMYGIYGAFAFTSSGADYGEYFEWEDSNANSEDRIGRFVTTNESKILIANSGDYILGAISGTATVIGNGYEDQWSEMEMHDVWGRPIWEEYDVPNRYDNIVKEDGSIEKVLIQEMHTDKRIKINPDYDQSKPYIPRSKRQEWDVVGMMGVLTVRDDGTCKPNSYCKVIDGGIASASDKGYRVLKRVADNVIKILFRGEAL